jgi:leader peptidase (prepilin peptidase)/N-methyltransferase
MIAWAPALLALLLGCAVGSFLNVVIARLPRMLEAQWNEQARAWLKEHPSAHAQSAHAASEPGPAESVPLSLARPASHCPACHTPIRWYDNLPLIGFIRLRGRCRQCGQAISWQYPLVEALTGLWFLAAYVLWGGDVTALCWAVFGSALIALSFIDAQHHLLPDDITLPLCWAGLLASALGLIPVDPVSAIWGAAAGYLMLWVVAQVYLRWRGFEGMGYGDLKLLAALGAWLGWQNLSMLVLVASVLGIIHGLLRSRAQREASPHFAFGPSLCLAAALLLLWGRGQPVALPF